VSLFVPVDAHISYTNVKGDSISFNFFSPFVITAAGGIEDHKNNVYGSPAPGRHGETRSGSRMDRRHIRLVGEIRKELDREEARQIFYRAFNNTLEGTLLFHNTRTRLWRNIRCELEELPIIEWSARRKCLTFEVPLVSLEPFWNGRSTVQRISENIKLWHFPMTFPQAGSNLLDNQMLFGVRNPNLSSFFDNVGNVASGFTAILRARIGTVVNPSIINETTGEQIRILHTMQPSDRIVIENYMHIKRIWLNDEDSFHLLDDEITTFFLIDVGRNHIGFRADINVINLYVEAIYTPLYTYVGGYDPAPTGLIRSPYLAMDQSTEYLVETTNGFLVHTAIEGTF